MERVPFSAFKEGFVEEAGLYVPRDPGNNVYRHFGVKRDRRLYLSHDELLYLHSRRAPDPCTLETRAYFELKNSDKNVLSDGLGRTHVYHKTKHFRRDAAPPIGVLVHRHRDDVLQAADTETIVCVAGEDAFCFVVLRPVAGLDPGTSAGLYK